MTPPSAMTQIEIADLADRLLTASGSQRLPRQLRRDLKLASQLLEAILRDGTIAGSVDLKGCADG
jgi:hypothetical protein